MINLSFSLSGASGGSSGRSRSEFTSARIWTARGVEGVCLIGRHFRFNDHTTVMEVYLSYPDLLGRVGELKCAGGLHDSRGPGVCRTDMDSSW